MSKLAPNQLQHMRTNQQTPRQKSWIIMGNWSAASTFFMGHRHGSSSTKRTCECELAFRAALEAGGEMACGRSASQCPVSFQSRPAVEHCIQHSFGGWWDDNLHRPVMLYLTRVRSAADLADDGTAQPGLEVPSAHRGAAGGRAARSRSRRPNKRQQRWENHNEDQPTEESAGIVTKRG